MMVRKLGDYTLTRRLGVGGMGEVWMGRREALGGAARDVAIKVLSPERASNAEARKMFLDEARLSMLLHNSNIVQVHDVAEAADKTCYMVMEFVDGLNLAELSEKLRATEERMPDTIIAFVIGEVLKGLVHAHELRHQGQRATIVHRDVSPHNVMISVFGEVKIMDFGIARVASEDTSGVHVKGKLRYMPPEQPRGETREPTLDLFAVGAMLHELLDGVKFRSQVLDETRLIGMILDGEIPALRRPTDSIPKELDYLRQRLLAPKAAERVSSAREAFRLLTHWPGYRDARFELDDLVRRYVGHDQPIPAPAGTQVLTNTVPLPAETPSAAGSLEGHVVPMFAATEGSDTNVLRARDASGTHTVVGRRTTTPNIRTTVIGVALGVMGVVFALIGGGVLLSSHEKDSAAEVVDTRPAAEAEIVGRPEAAKVAEPVVPERAVTPPVEPPPVEPPPVEPPPVAPLSEQPEQTKEASQIEPAKPAAVKKSKVQVKLGSGVAWAEVKIGGQKFELDAFSGTSRSTRIPTGPQTVSMRTTVDGKWTTVKVTIPDGSATILLAKNGKVSIE
jgi:serine/threonine protein kinase